MKLFPLQQSLLDLLELQPGPIAEAKVIWGQRSGKNLTMNKFYDNHKEDGQHLIFSKSYEESDNPFIRYFCTFEDLFEALDNPDTKISSVTIEELDFVGDNFHAQLMYKSLLDKLEHITKDWQYGDTKVYFVIIGSMGIKSNTKCLFRNKGIETIAASWEVNTDIHVSAFNWANLEASMRDFGSVQI